MSGEPMAVEGNLSRSPLRLNVPLTGLEEVELAAAVLATGYLTQGPRAGELEAALASHTGVTHAFATSSCTTALHLALVGMGVGPADEVVVADFTFPATANVVVQQGARPVLVDVDPATYNATADTIAPALTERTKAIMVVDTFGQCADYDPIIVMAAERGIPVIEDAACAIGGEYRGRAAGSITEVGCISFHPRKIITTGEGGMVLTSDDELAEKLAVLRSHGGVRGELYLSFVAAGFNYRLSDINAAVGLAQFARLPGIIASRQEQAAQLGQALAGVPGVTLPVTLPVVSHTYQSYVVTLDDEIDRDEVIRGMKAAGVETTLGTYALHAQPYFADAFGYRPGQLPNSARLFAQTLTLPCYPQMTKDDVALVAQSLTDVLAGL
ncbi:MAG: DegT/DnrJ/EryC1/StrS family aminotransferase [Candidatus Nanopelagicales bacterium]